MGLTDEGWRVVAEMYQKVKALSDEVTTRLTDREVATLVRLLEKLDSGTG